MFFQETMSKIRRHYQSKNTRSQIRKRQPKMHRKSSLEEIFNPSSGHRALLSPNQIEQTPSSLDGSGLFPSRSAVGVVSIKMERVHTPGKGAYLADLIYGFLSL